MKTPSADTSPPSPSMPPAAGADQQFGMRLAAGRFEVQRCQSCASHFFYPRVVCPQCGSAKSEWIAASGRGVVYSTTTVRRKAEQGGDYNVAIIELEEGPRMMSRVDGIPSADVSIGMTVSARIVTKEDRYFVVFAAATAEGAV